MSAKQIALVWDVDVDWQSRLILLVLADEADDFGVVRLAEFDRLAWKLGIAPSRLAKRLWALGRAGTFAIIPDGLCLHLNTLPKRAPYQPAS